MAGDAARLRTHVREGREIVMVLLMEVRMMVMLDVEEILFVAATIVNSLGPISTRKMTVVMLHPQLQKDLHQSFFQELH